MKKTTLFLMFSLFALCTSVNAQTDYYTALANNNGTSPNGRAPQAFDRVNRSVWLISATDMAAAGYVNGDILTSIGFTYVEAADAAVSGSFKVYLQNTANTTNTKSTTWATAIGGMTLASNNTINLPAIVGSIDFPFSGGTAFTYTGGGIYIATDYQNLTGTVATVTNTASCNNTLTAGLLGARTTSATPPTALTASAFRPETRFGKSVACARPLDVTVPASTLNSASISFTSSNPVNLEYGAYDFVPGTAAGTTISGVSSVYNLTGLTPSTAYEVYTKSDCGSFVGISAATNPVSFHTTFQPANPTYNTSLEVDDFPNVGWVADPEANNSDWFIVFGGTGSVLVQNGMYSAVSLSNAVATADARLYTRGVNLQAGSPATISYYIRNYQASSTLIGSYSLTVGTGQTAASQTTTITSDPALASTTFSLKTFTYTPPSTGVYYFGFLNSSPVNGTAATTQGIILDNFTVTQALATNQVLESKFSTYPNPAKNVINVTNTTDASISSIEMTDLNGRVVKSVKFSNVPEAQVSVSDLAQGVYMMKIVSDKGIATKKVIKE